MLHVHGMSVVGGGGAVSLSVTQEPAWKRSFHQMLLDVIPEEMWFLRSWTVKEIPGMEMLLFP